MVSLVYPRLSETNCRYFLTAVVEQVRDGSTVRVRLLMPEGDHQFVNIALAGVRSPKTSGKLGEPSEQWGDEVHLKLVPVCKCTMLISYANLLGKILH